MDGEPLPLLGIFPHLVHRGLADVEGGELGLEVKLLIADFAGRTTGAEAGSRTRLYWLEPPAKRPVVQSKTRSGLRVTGSPFMPEAMMLAD